MAMTDSFVLILISVLAVAAALFKRSGIKKKSTAAQAKPPKNTASDAALDDVQESLKEELDRIKAATDGDSPADDLADLGNARKRR